MTQSELDALMQAPLGHKRTNNPYTPSIASSASSSFESIFSADGQSSQSSDPSSSKSSPLCVDGDSRRIGSKTASGDAEHTTAGGAAGATVGSNAKPTDRNSLESNLLWVSRNYNNSRSPSLKTRDLAVPPELRTHPRRTPCANNAESDGTAACNPRPPPSLVRQYDRKDNFVESLVDTTTQMIEVIWPLSVLACGRDAVIGGKNLIGLRTFIQEVLKRSKTSYSTLQVALYYLVLIKPCIPKVDFTKEQSEDTHASRAMQCGRRMFLAALILASKYLQDRNYSARAWSKISGLRVSEINSNEIAFVTAVDWKLHIPEPRFQRWTDVVLKYSLSQSSLPIRACTSPSNVWRHIIPLLTPELLEEETSRFSMMTLASKIDRRLSPSTISPAIPRMSPPSMLPKSSIHRATPSSRTPTPTPAKPEALEPTPRANVENYRFPPISPRITQLPTPQMTPRSNIFCTPAASVSNLCPSNSAMSGAMRQAQRLSLARCAIDSWPTINHNLAAPQRKCPLLRSSLAPSTASMMSSPESMISDISSLSSRSSRSSSISSAASLIGAFPSSDNLAVQALRRSADRSMAGTDMHMASIMENKIPMLRSVSPPDGLWETTNPFAGAAQESYVRGEKDLASDTAAAIALHELAVANSKRGLCLDQSKREIQRKRERPSSGLDSLVQDNVRAMLRAEQAMNSVVASPGDEIALEYSKNAHLASSYLARDSQRWPNSDADSKAQTSFTNSGSQHGARKRMCYQEQAASCHSPNFVARPAMGPGMWADVL